MRRVIPAEFLCRPGKNYVYLSGFDGKKVPPLGHTWTEYGFTVIQGVYIMSNTHQFCSKVKTCLLDRNTFV